MIPGNAGPIYSESPNKILNEVYTTADYQKKRPLRFPSIPSLSENGMHDVHHVNTPTQGRGSGHVEKWKGNTQKIYAAILKDLT